MTYNVFGEMLSLTLLLARGQPDGLEFATDNLRDPTVSRGSFTYAEDLFVHDVLMYAVPWRFYDNMIY